MQYKRFGIMIDCSGNAVMNISTVKSLIDKMQLMGYNYLEICTDDTFKIESEPYFGYLRGGYTEKEIRELDAYARERGIELVPCIQTLSHLSNLLKLPHYNKIVDFNNVLLVDEPETYELIEKMFDALSKMYTSRLVNIGMDEAHFLGMGRYLQKHGYEPQLQIFLRHLNKVVEIAKKYGFKPHYWSDMLFKLVSDDGSYYHSDAHVPEDIKRQLPEDAGIVYWDYGEHDIKQEIFDGMFKAHNELNREIWFAGDAWASNGFAPHNVWSLKTAQYTMRGVREHNIQNVMITVWAGNGWECSYFAVLPSMYAMKQYAEGNFDEASIKSGFEKTFGVSFDDMLLLDLPNKSLSNPDMDKISSACKTLLYNDCFLGWKDSKVEEEWPIPYKNYAEQLAAVKSRAGEYAYLFDILEKLCSALELKADLGIRTRRAYKSGNKQALRELIDVYAETERRVGEFHRAFKACWMKENKPYGWEVHEARLGGLRSRILDCRERIDLYLKGKIKEIPELSETILPYADWKLQYNNYSGLISVGNM